MPPERPAYVLRRLWLEEPTFSAYYGGFANEGLWPLCHVAHVRPVFRTGDWLCYREINQRFADAVLKEAKMDYEQRMGLLDEFDIKAPEAGMVMYVKGYDGKPIKAGSQVNAWDPAVAALPDLSKMLSITYINEVDIRKIKVGQRVEIGLDAFPEKKFRGKVINVANAGEQRPNTDSKVFQATIEISGTDPSLRPAMTTGNRIIIQELDSANFIPLECLHSYKDSITYVYKRVGIGVQKQEVKTGIRNNNAAVIELGLDAGDRVYLSIPAGQENESIKLLSELDGKRNQRQEEQAGPEQGAEEVSAQGEGRRGGGQRPPRQGAD